MQSYRELREAHHGTPPAPAPHLEPTVLSHLLHQHAEPYPRWLREALAQYAHLQRVAPQLIQGMLLSLWWEYGREVPGCTSPGRYR